MTVYRVWEMGYGLSVGTFESADAAPELLDLTLGLNPELTIEEREYPIELNDFAPDKVLVEWVLLVNGREAAWVGRADGQPVYK